MYLKQLQGNSKKLWIAILVLGLGSLAASTLIATKFLGSQKSQALEGSPAIASEPTMTTVTALGRLEPQGEITRLSAPLASQRLAKVLVAEGDQVQSGQVIAISDSLETRQATLAEAEAKLQSALARLATVQAGRKEADINAQYHRVSMTEAQWIGDIEAQKSVIASLEAEHRSAEADYQRYKSLYQEGAISASEFDLKKVAMESLKEQLPGAQATLARITQAGQAQAQAEQNTLESISEVRAVDVAEAEALVAEAEALRSKAAADLELAYVRSPVEGQIVALHAKSGETVGAQGLADIGQTQQMYAVAEIYETDIRHVRIGQKATLISEYGGFLGELTGDVEHIGLQISKPGTTNDDPTAAADVRVVEVKIRIDPEDSERVKHLNKLQVRASIEI